MNIKLEDKEALDVLFVTLRLSEYELKIVHVVGDHYIHYNIIKNDLRVGEIIINNQNHHIYSAYNKNISDCIETTSVKVLASWILENIVD